MKNNLVQLFGGALALVALVAVISLALSLRPQASSPGSSLQPLEERLLALGIPVQSVTLTSQSPLEIEVILRSSEGDEPSKREDLWNTFLADRELELAYLNFALPIESYRLAVVTAAGEALYDNTSFLPPDLPSQKFTPAPPSSVENGQTKEILEGNLDLHGLKLLALEVPASYTARDNSKLVTLDLSTGTTAEKIDMAPIDQFIQSLRPQMEAINDRYGTRIVLVRAQIQDADDQLLVDYMEDIERWAQSFWVADNIEGGWYSLPAPDLSSGPEETSAPVLIPPTPTATPPLSVAPPAPTPNPYP
jgi:hypothetical protein